MIGELAVSPDREDAPPNIPDSAAVHRLLLGYQALLEEAADVRRRSLVRRLWRWGFDRSSVEYVRRSLDILERRYNAYAALARRPDAGALDARARVAQFAASLPPAPSRLRWLLPAAAVLVLARLLFWYEGLYTGIEDDELGRLASAAAQLADLNLGNVSELTTLLLATSLAVTSYVVLVFGIATYLILRPLGNGAIASRTVLAGLPLVAGSASTTTNEGWPLDSGSGSAKREVFGSAGLDPPAHPRVDLIAKAAIVAPFLLIACLNWQEFLAGVGTGEGGEAWKPGLRLHRTPRRRHAGPNSGGGRGAAAAVVAGCRGASSTDPGRPAEREFESGQRGLVTPWPGLCGRAARSSPPGSDFTLCRTIGHRASGSRPRPSTLATCRARGSAPRAWRSTPSTRATNRVTTRMFVCARPIAERSTSGCRPAGRMQASTGPLGWFRAASKWYRTKPSRRVRDPVCPRGRPSG